MNRRFHRLFAAPAWRPVPTTASVGLALLLGACAVGPDYRRPDIVLPDHFKEAASAPGGAAAPSPASAWQPAHPADDVPRGAWWTAMGDPELDALETRVARANATLQAAAASYRQARALDEQARAALFPTVSADASITRSGGGSTGAVKGSVPAHTARAVTLGASWEADLWGRVRRNVEAQHAQAQASEADLASTQLSLQAQAAVDYVALRIADAQQALLQDTVAAYAKSLTITQNRYRAGVVTSADVAQARTQLLTVQSQLTDARLQREQLEHALAVLAGEAPANFSVAPRPGLTPAAASASAPAMGASAAPEAMPSARPTPLVAAAEVPASGPATSATVLLIEDTDRLGLHLPVVPASLPATLLERRPDVAAAERRVAAANAQIGVAQAAYFPTLTLSASGGYSGLTGTDLFSAANRVWSLGPALAETLFDAGARSAAKAGAVAAYDQAAANYRQTVLSALSDVEDQLAAQRDLTQEYATQAQAVAAALESLRLAQNQYLAGTVDYLTVASAQSTALAAQRSALDIQQRRYTAAIDLIKALGGGWAGLDGGPKQDTAR